MSRSQNPFKMNRETVMILLLMLLPVSAVYSQATSVPSKQATLKDLHFMAGTWRTTTNWGDMEEYWSDPMGNSMMCTYRCVKNGKVVFYEWIVIEQTENDSVPVMKLRHFNPGSIGWEDKESPYLYPLVYADSSKVIFERPDKKTSISYERLSTGTLKSVLVQEKDGKKTSTEFIFSFSTSK